MAPLPKSLNVIIQNLKFPYRPFLKNEEITISGRAIEIVKSVKPKPYF